ARAASSCSRHSRCQVWNWASRSASAFSRARSRRVSAARRRALTRAENFRAAGAREASALTVGSLIRTCRAPGRKPRSGRVGGTHFLQLVVLFVRGLGLAGHRSLLTECAPELLRGFGLLRVLGDKSARQHRTQGAVADAAGDHAGGGRRAFPISSEFRCSHLRGSFVVGIAPGEAALVALVDLRLDAIKPRVVVGPPRLSAPPPLLAVSLARCGHGAAGRR